MADTLRNLPDIGQAVTELVEDIQRIMVALYDFQVSLAAPNTPFFVQVRKDLKGQWEMLRIYLQRCHGFGEDVLLLGDALGQESKADLLEFMDDMKASANELQDISAKLKGHDMSEAFSKEIQAGEPANSSSHNSVKDIQNDHLKTFVVAVVGLGKHQSLVEIDKALLNSKSNIENIFLFWDETSKGCSALVENIRNKGTNLTAVDAEKIVSKWKVYQEKILAAVLSITKTADAILVEGAPKVGLLSAPPIPISEPQRVEIDEAKPTPPQTVIPEPQSIGSGKSKRRNRFGLGTFRDWFKRLGKVKVKGNGKPKQPLSSLPDPTPKEEIRQ